MKSKRLTMGDIKRHVIINKESGCWSWNGSLLRGKTPILKFKNKTVYPKRAAWVLRNRCAVPKGMCIVNTHDKSVCDDPMCINPAHTEPVTKGVVQRRTVATGMLHTQVARAKISATKSRASKLSDEAVADIRYGGDSAAQAAQKHGITEAYVHMLRKGQFRNPAIGNPFAGLFTGLAANDAGRVRA